MGFPRKSRSEFRVVSVTDDALDVDALAGRAAIVEYSNDRDLAKLLAAPGAVLPGGRPMVFVLRPLAYRQRNWLESIRDDKERWLYAFAAALVRVEGCDFWSPRSKEAAKDIGGAIVDPVSVAELADEIGAQVIDEIGAVALQQARLSAHQGKAFALPHGFEVGWDGRSPATSQDTPTDSAGG